MMPRPAPILAAAMARIPVPSSDVEKASADVVLLDRFQAESRCFVRAGAESHAGIDADKEMIIRSRRVQTTAVR